MAQRSFLRYYLTTKAGIYIISTCGLVAMTSASHAEGRQLNPGQVYSLMASISSGAFR